MTSKIKKRDKKVVKAMLERFSIAQMTSNADGKTSMSGTMGGLLCTASVIGFLFGAFVKHADLVNQSVALAVIGAGLLGYRKSQSTEPEEPVEEPAKETPADEPAEEDSEKPLLLKS